MIYNFILFYILLFIYLFLETESFPPEGRSGHSSVLVRDKIYFFGGFINNYACSNQVFYLDVSQPFNTIEPPWNDITLDAEIPFESCWGTALLSDINQMVYLFGSNKDNFASFNSSSLKWKPIIGAPTRGLIDGVIDSTGNIYIFGGVTNQNYSNSMIIIDSVELAWTSSTVDYRDRYTATLLQNGIIVYIGGYSSYLKRDVDIYQINRYDTNTSTWLEVMTSKFAETFDNRHSHIAVLAYDGKIIVHGGSTSTKGDTTQVIPKLAVLDTNTEPYEWTVPNVSGLTPSLVNHSANLVGNYMILAFGNSIADIKIDEEKLNTKIYILDVGNYTWVDTFDPKNMITITSDDNNNSRENNRKVMVLIGMVSGGLGAVTLVTIGIFGYKRYQKKKYYDKWFRKHVMSFN